VNDYVPFFGVPAPLPTGHEILGKTEPTAQKFFGKKNRMRTLVNKAEIGATVTVLSKAWGWVDGTHRIISKCDGASGIGMFSLTAF
jgi:hypothetical protein